MARVVLDQVSKVFAGPHGRPVPAVRNLDLEVAERELVVLVGPSGCGKTTTLRLVAGLEAVTAGAISIGGRIVNGVEPHERGVAMVFQNGALYPHMTVFENLAFGLKLRKVPRAELEQRVRTIADTLGLGSLLDRLPQALSGGQRQRVAVGRAIVLQPQVFLFDEPLSSLDAGSRGLLRVELKRLHQHLGATTLYVTHDQVEAMSLGDRLVVLRDGVVQQIGAPLDLYQRPANLFVAGFIGSPPINLFRGVLEARGEALWFRLADAGAAAAPGELAWRVPAAQWGSLKAHVGAPLVLGLRPEAIGPAASGETPPDAQPVVARIDLVESLGAEIHVHGAVGDMRFTARWPAGPLPRTGEPLPVRLDLGQAHYFDALSEKRIE